MKKNRTRYFFILLIVILVNISVFSNVRANTGKTLTLTATPNASKNYIALNWIMSDNSQPYSYQIYQKKEGSSVWESIPAKERVKVLNIYPNNMNGYNRITNTGLSEGQIDLEGKSVPDSGILKTWLLKENIDDISIDTVSLSDFNNNPSKYLKKINGLWNYDAIFYGMWNLLPERVYPNDNAIEHLRTFIHDGGGFMTSHHTIGYRGLDKGVNKLANELGVEIFSNQTYEKCSLYAGRDASGKLYPTVSFEMIEEDVKCDNSSYWSTGSQVQIVKKGLLTEHPFKVGEIGQIYTIPYHHGLSVFGKGEVWMKTVNPTGFEDIPFKEITVSPKTGKKGTNNFYVHTYNNTAIINSGHSFPKISQAEVRIIANTLYYLAQITTNNSKIDHSGMDIKAPSKPTINKTTFDDSNKKTIIEFNPKQDIGTTYSYQVVATNRNTGEKIHSNEVTTTITSGFKGFSYVIDNKPDTIPNGTVNSTTGKIEIPISANQNSYLHIQAIDKAGNISETAHFLLKDIVEEKLEVTVPNIQPFPTIVLQDQPKAYKTSFTSSINIKNYYPETGKGWRLDVSASQFKLVGEQYTLPKGTIRLEPLSSIERVGEGLGSLPTKGITQKTVIDNGKVTVANATSGNGIGEYKLTFPQNALEIVIDPTTAKRGRYQSTITWELVQAP